MDIAMKIKRRCATTSSSLSSLAALFALATLMLLFGVTVVGAQENPSVTQSRQWGNDDITRREIASMDRFLDAHPEIAEQLRKDPSRIDSREFVDNHPALHEYLQQHPNVRVAFKEHPDAFMRDEERYDRQGDRDHDRDRDITRKDLQEMDRFLDHHPEVAEQLRKDPSLIDNRQWVAGHSDLREFLEKNPQVREEFREHPDQFMRAEERYDQHEGDRDHDWNRDHDARMGGDNDRNRGEYTSFGQFLGGHSNVATELSSDPSLATNKEYLATHPELDQYLKAHPTMSQQLTANPQAVMSSTWVQQGSGIGTKQPTMPKEMPKEEKPPNQ